MGRDDCAAIIHRSHTRQQAIAERILKEISRRLGFLVNVGLDYLTLNRSAGSLSGGEAQRIRLATQIGSRLMGVLYVLDEPSIGLHPRDNTRLLRHAQGPARPGQLPSWWWNMTMRPSSPRTGSSTWVLERVSTAARSSPKARPGRSSTTPNR